MTGMESMFNALLKAMGFDPAVLQAQITGFMQSTHDTLAAFRTQFDRLESKLDRVQDTLDMIAPQVPPASCGVDTDMEPVILTIADTRKEAA